MTYTNINMQITYKINTQVRKSVQKNEKENRK